MMLCLVDYEKLTLMPGFCLIRPAQGPAVTGRLHLPERARRTDAWGVVINIANTSGEPGFGVGDWVIFRRYAAAHLETAEGEDICLVRTADVDAVWELDGPSAASGHRGARCLNQP